MTSLDSLVSCRDPALMSAVQAIAYEPSSSIEVFNASIRSLSTVIRSAVRNPKS